jgi:hypothetical protein
MFIRNFKMECAYRMKNAEETNEKDTNKDGRKEPKKKRKIIIYWCGSVEASVTGLLNMTMKCGVPNNTGKLSIRSARRLRLHTENIPSLFLVFKLGSASIQLKSTEQRQQTVSSVIYLKKTLTSHQ